MPHSLEIAKSVDQLAIDRFLIGPFGQERDTIARRRHFFWRTKRLSSQLGKHFTGRRFPQGCQFLGSLKDVIIYIQSRPHH